LTSLVENYRRNRSNLAIRLSVGKQQSNIGINPFGGKKNGRELMSWLWNQGKTIASGKKAIGSFTRKPKHFLVKRKERKGEEVNTLKPVKRPLK